MWCCISYLFVSAARLKKLTRTALIVAWVGIGGFLLQGGLNEDCRFLLLRVSISLRVYMFCTFSQDTEDHSTWETRYGLLLWLSMLSLVPFDIDTIDSGLGEAPGDEERSSPVAMVGDRQADLVGTILSLGMKHLEDAGPTRCDHFLCVYGIPFISWTFPGTIPGTFPVLERSQIRGNRLGVPDAPAPSSPIHCPTYFLHISKHVPTITVSNPLKHFICVCIPSYIYIYIFSYQGRGSSLSEQPPHAAGHGGASSPPFLGGI